MKRMIAKQLLHLASLMNRPFQRSVCCDPSLKFFDCALSRYHSHNHSPGSLSYLISLSLWFKQKVIGNCKMIISCESPVISADAFILLRSGSNWSPRFLAEPKRSKSGDGGAEGKTKRY